MGPRRIGICRLLGAWLAVPLLLGGCWTYVTKEAQQRFEVRARPFTVTVYPVDVIKGDSIERDAALGRRLAARLAQEDLADPVIAPSALDVPFHWGHNQAAMARESALAFAAKVKDAGLATDYALHVQILCDGRETQVVGVHYYLAERSGLLADGGLTNSHWEEFKAVQPRDRNDGLEVLARMLRRQWKRG